MIKTFPKTRICVIDCHSSLQTGLQKALDFVKKHNIPLSSSDGKKILLTYCLSSIETEYKQTNSAYPKVLCISKKSITKRIQPFVDTYFDVMMSYLPVPYCGKFDLSSPDLESAAESSLKKFKPRRKYNEFLQKLNARHVN